MRVGLPGANYFHMMNELKNVWHRCYYLLQTHRNIASCYIYFMPTSTKVTSALAAVFLLSLLITTVCEGETSFNRKVTLGEGFLDVTTISGVDPRGIRDSTRGLNRALQQAMRQTKVAYFPPGIYLVSNTIQGLYKSSDRRCGGSHNAAHPYVLVGSKAGGKRPVIKLKDNAGGISNANSTKPVVHLEHLDRSGKEEADCAFGYGTAQVVFRKAMLGAFSRGNLNWNAWPARF